MILPFRRRKTTHTIGVDLRSLAFSVASLAHADQLDKSGRPYILHPVRVAVALKRQGANAEIEAVALLHDVVEDNPEWTLETLEEWGFPLVVLEAVDAITKREGERYEDYLCRVRENKIALAVKCADITDNLAPERLALLDELTAARLIRKYTKASFILGFDSDGVA